MKAACEVLEQVSGGPVVPGTLSLQGTTFPSEAVNVGSQISGALDGDVVYDMSGTTAQKLAGLLTGVKTHGFGRAVGNGLAELGEKMAGETRRQLSESGRRCDISGPSVFRGLNVEFFMKAPALSVLIDTNAGPVRVNVAVRNGKQD